MNEVGETTGMSTMSERSARCSFLLSFNQTNDYEVQNFEKGCYRSQMGEHREGRENDRASIVCYDAGPNGRRCAACRWVLIVVSGQYDVLPPQTKPKEL